MELSELTVRLIFLFLPGIIATTVFKIYQNRGILSNRDFFVNVVLTGLLSYFITGLFYALTKNKLVFIDALFDESIQINTNEIVISSCIAIVIGVMQTLVINNGCLYKIGKKLTTRTGHDSVWDEVFDNQNEGFDGFVYITFLEKNLLYAGFVENYSMSFTGKKELFLSNVDVYAADNRKEKLYSLEKLYLQILDDSNIIIEMKGAEEDGTRKGTKESES